MTKNVQVGTTKTTLGHALGTEKACALYKASLTYTRELVEGTSGVKYIYYDKYVNQRDDWDNCKFIKARQEGGSLRASIAKAVESAFARSFNGVLLLAADCPQLLHAHITNALSLLAKGQSVLGRTYAGGFYALGIPEPYPWLFETNWTKGERANALMAALVNHKITYHLLPTLYDLSRVEDLEALADNPIVAPYLKTGENALT